MKRPLKIQILKKNKQWYFRIVAGNGRILCHSETYSSYAKCLKSVSVLVVSMVEDNYLIVDTK